MMTHPNWGVVIIISVEHCQFFVCKLSLCVADCDACSTIALQEQQQPSQQQCNVAAGVAVDHAQAHLTDTGSVPS